MHCSYISSWKITIYQCKRDISDSLGASSIEQTNSLAVFSTTGMWENFGSHRFLCCFGSCLELSSASGKESACQSKRPKRCKFDPWVGKIPWRRAMATHCSILSQRIPWVMEPGGLQSLGSQRVEYNWSNLSCAILGKASIYLKLVYKYCHENKRIMTLVQQSQ